MAVFKIVFMFVAQNADPEKHRVSLSTSPGRELVVIGVKDYKQAVEVSKKLVEQEGVGVIELCAGFGHVGTAEVAKAVGNKVRVGVVRFDSHPALEFKSGDDIFKI
ncbi:hypothetical protein IBX65_02095 [Candidatus Aerophobetes bacterium]|nr:hypothetical protein [Candidatus Aerophobetes bacterium]